MPAPLPSDIPIRPPRARTNDPDLGLYDHLLLRRARGKECSFVHHRHEVNTLNAFSGDHNCLPHRRDFDIALHGLLLLFVPEWGMLDALRFDRSLECCKT
jgi:hypothetical protein